MPSGKTLSSCAKMCRLANNAQLQGITSTERLEGGVVVGGLGYSSKEMIE